MGVGIWSAFKSWNKCSSSLMLRLRMYFSLLVIQKLMRRHFLMRVCHMCCALTRITQLWMNPVLYSLMRFTKLSFLNEKTAAILSILLNKQSVWQKELNPKAIFSLCLLPRKTIHIQIFILVKVRLL